MSIVEGGTFSLCNFRVSMIVSRGKKKKKERKIEKSSFEIDNRIFIRGRTSCVVKLIQ